MTQAQFEPMNVTCNFIGLELELIGKKKKKKKKIDMSDIEVCKQTP